eukprot:3061230-Alexandrium_andersonii.AAC.1
MAPSRSCFARARRSARTRASPSMAASSAGSRRPRGGGLQTPDGTGLVFLFQTPLRLRSTSWSSVRPPSRMRTSGTRGVGGSPVR